MVIDEKLCYTIVDDVSFQMQNSIFDASFYILGSNKVNSYIKLPNNLVAYCQAIINLLDGNHSIEAIEEKLYLQFNKQVDVSMFISKLNQAGLLVNSDEQFDNEMNLTGINIATKHYKENKQPFNQCFRILYNIFSKVIVWFVVIIILFILGSFSNSGSKSLVYDDNNIITSSLIVLILTVLCFFIHELGHACSASGNKISIKSFSFGLNLGIMPMFYFTYYNLKAAEPKVKLKITIAGVYINFILSGICYTLSRFTWINGNVSHILYLFAILNIMMITSNLFPFRLSDGYYILSLLLNKFDLRITILRSLLKKESMSHINKRSKIILCVYFLFFLITFILSMKTILNTIFDNIYQGNYIVGIGIFAFTVLTILLTILNISYKSRRKSPVIVKLITNRLRNKFELRRNVPIMLGVLFLIAIIISSTVIYQNAKHNMLHDYWSKNGSADLLILSTKEDDMKIASIISEYLVVPMKITTHGSITGYENLEESVILGYADVNQLNYLYNLGSYNKMEIGEASINGTLAKKLKLELNNEITLGESNYLITNISDRINLLGTDKNMILIHRLDDMKDNDYTAYLVNCMHEEKSIENVISVLNQNNINYINLYDNIGTIMNEFQRLLGSIIILILVVIIICSVLIYNLFSINLKRCLSQWGTLRTLGLKNSTMVRVMVLETLLFSVVGIIGGAILGTSLGYLISLFSGTKVHYIIPDNLILFSATAIGIVIPITSVLISIKPVYGKQPIEILFARKKQMPTGNDKIRNLVHLAIGLIIIVCSILPVSTRMDKDILVVLYGVQFLSSFIGVTLILIPIIKYATKLLESSKSQSIKLACQNIRINIANIKGIVISISLTVIIFCTMVGFSANYKEWAGAMAHEQLGFDILLSSKNNALYQGYMDSYIVNEDIVVIGDNYLDTVNIRGIDNYICAISPEDFNRIYKSKIDLDNLQGNRVVMPSKLMVDLNVNQGDELLLNYKGREKNVIVGEMTEVMDYSSRVVYISKDLFDVEAFAKYTVYANANDNTTLDYLEKKAIEKNLNFLSVVDIKEDWKANIVSGVKEIEYMIVVILAILIFMLKNTLESNIEERKHDFMILRSIGLKRNKVNTILSMEFLVTQVITIIISVCIGSIASLKFFYMNSVTSGYTIDYDVTWLAFILIGVIFLIISYLFVLRVFRKTSNKDIINEIRMY